MKLHILCGIPGSGKSTIASNLPGYVVSTDSIREFLWGDASISKHEKLVFRLAEYIIDYFLAKGEEVIFDATNLTMKARNKYINMAKSYKAKVVLHWVDTPLDVAIERNMNRDRKVPIQGIKALYRSFQRPSIEEGIDIIKFYEEDLNINKVITPKGTVKR